MVLEGLEGGKGGTAGEQLVAELGLVVGLVLVVDLVVLFLGVTWGESCQFTTDARSREGLIVPKPNILMNLMGVQRDY